MRDPMKVFQARKLALAGFLVFPLLPNSKRPAIRNWPMLATTDVKEIDLWWEENPNYNIGIHTRGLMVVDLDPKHGGPESWVTLLEGQAMLDNELPVTLTVRTPSGGRHLYFKLPPGREVANSVHKLGPGIDVRGKGGYVVGPGSVVDGKTYEVVHGEE